MSLCPYAYLRVSLSGLLTASDQGSLTTFGELFNISALDPLLPTLLITTLCLCALLTILYYSLVVAWEVFWASRRSPSPLDPSAEVVLTQPERGLHKPDLQEKGPRKYSQLPTYNPPEHQLQNLHQSPLPQAGRHSPRSDQPQSSWILKKQKHL